MKFFHASVKVAILLFKAKLAHLDSGVSVHAYWDVPHMTAKNMLAYHCKGLDSKCEAVTLWGSIRRYKTAVKDIAAA